MNEPTSDILDQRIESALGRLPHWQPTADFAPRLAAAAARQAQQPAVSPMLAMTGSLLLRLSETTPIVLAGLTVAGLLTWAVPWDVLIRSADFVSWTCATVLAISGLWLTRRTLVSR